MIHPINRGELRHAQLAILVAIILQLSLPDSLRVGSKYLVAGLELLLLFGIWYTAPRRHKGAEVTHRTISILLIGIISLANAGQLALLIRSLVDGTNLPGRSLLTGALAIFLTNIIMFGLWYWEMASPGLSGKHSNDNEEHFQFPQDQNRDKSWGPSFFDFLFLSLTNSTAFSPTDTMPLTHAAKALMSAQALISLLTVVLVTARAVNILG